MLHVGMHTRRWNLMGNRANSEELMTKEITIRLEEGYSGPHVQDSFPPSLSWPAFFNRSGVALPQV